MARIHAFIILASHPVDLDTVSQKLNISRGNASMCLKELRNWGVIQRVHISGDRRDFYVAEPDVWKMFFRIAVERKKREFDPALDSIRQLTTELSVPKDNKVRERLSQMESILTTVDQLMKRFLEDETKSKTLLNFFKNFTPK
jgi:DNA-binding transcriptional regulator GbsR (MarR family)